MTDWRSDLELITDAARQAGAVAMQHFRQSPEVWWKNEGRSPVSAADYAANAVLETVLRSARPEYGWLSEETEDTSCRLERETLFVIDPIDGTRAFIAGLDTWCVSVAVVHLGKPVAGVLVAPSLDEEFSASEAGEATRNGVPIRVSRHIAGDHLRLAVAEDLLNRLDPLFVRDVERIKHVPSLAYRLAMIADGRIDGTLVKRNAHDWDLAAADLILERAGGSLVDLAGERLVYNRAKVSHDELCAATNADLPRLLRHLGLGLQG
ncbi:3'(2'),5'-bisphosphate nucleotidase CysQ [Rhizobiaceae bacterium n13]|uniref:3'(2'),5'-bisphosphate nucleotidase CysQ n=1 Tax=Ferirhizobium litorale TaxID=2927786 RepID=A0AAE3U045_9HYPH|nr:3'(2'),5'-bisphosphate nucleotidase CysQ [Fererhizobium litorale]MDI7861538.1 3'(2'),5'-bisphosphate nucleotidase CysQ [Fererhizobium litorale]MDI7921684.1 3'(2'),5'-bisphosphate nucleotidase CysQ [Fererhizobium litorale]